LTSPIAICIPTRNQGEYLVDALRSAFAQTVRPMDVVVSDDAGTDDTEAVVQNFAKSLAKEQAQCLRYERSSIPLGIGGNFDRAVRLGKGDLCVKLDADDILEPNFVEVLSGMLGAYPQAGWAHCNVLNVLPDCTPITLAHSRKRTGFYSSEAALWPYLKHNDTCHCVMIRKSAYLAVGGYRPEMKTCEDWLFWLEMLLGDWGYVFDERPLAKMRKHPSRTELMSRRRMAFVESTRFMVPRMEKLFREKAADKIKVSPEKAMARFRAATARLCVSSGSGEGDPEVRKALFKAALDFYPSLLNRIWYLAGTNLPPSTTMLATRLAGMPRHYARVILQPLLRR